MRMRSSLIAGFAAALRHRYALSWIVALTCMPHGGRSPALLPNGKQNSSTAATISTATAMVFAVSDRETLLVTPAYPLYPYQRQVLADIVRALSSPERRAVAHLPTGAGKTRIASHAACRLLNETDAGESLVIWLAATEELCEQAADELAKAWGYLGLRDATIHRYWGNRRLDLRRLTSGFLVTGLAKLRSVASRDHTLLAHLAHRASAVIFDEAHQAVAETYAFVAEQLCSVRPPLLGLTATPGRTAHLTEADYRLAQMFDHKKVSIDPKGHDSAVTYLIQNRYLADPRFVPVDFDSDIAIADPTPGNDYGTVDLDRLGHDTNRTRRIVDLAVSALRRHQRTIVFCPSVQSAVTCTSVLHNKGIAALVLTADTPREVRQASIAHFRSSHSDHMLLFNYGVLTAGFDAPRTSCAIIARPTTSLVLYSQMAGRALRGPRAGGNSRAEIITVVDTDLPGFGSVTEAFTNWEALWTNN